MHIGRFLALAALAASFTAVTDGKSFMSAYTSLSGCICKVIDVQEIGRIQPSTAEALPASPSGP
jgi:hypothetical protein